MSDLTTLAALLKQRNEIDKQIAALTGRPATTGHIGEYIAAHVFDIALLPSASHKTIDGHFKSGPLAQRSVNIKCYGKLEGLLDLSPGLQPDFILVLAGPKSAAMSSRGRHRPFTIESVFLFDAVRLVSELRATGIKVGIATSVRQHWWEHAEIYPNQRNGAILVSPEQKAALALFH